VILGERDLVRYAADPSVDLTEPFVRHACAKGDRCYGVLDGETLASYKWCSTRPTDVDAHLRLQFGDEWFYTYKAFTLPAYRGQRLHAALTARVLAEAATRRARGSISCVEINNVPSLNSFARMGATRVGTLCAVRVFGRYWTPRSPGCGVHRLSLIPVMHPWQFKDSPYV
jgi:hypothetical protein